MKELNHTDVLVAHTDSLTNMLHIFDGDEAAIGEYEYEAFKVARTRYRNELGNVKVTRDME